MKCFACSIIGVASVVAIGAAVVGFAPAPAAPAEKVSAASTFEVDTVHSAVVFKIQHAGVSNFYGTFAKTTGTVNWDSDKPEGSSITIAIDAESISSGNAKRDQHLRNPDFFNAKEFPQITFKSTGMKKTGEKTFELSGDLTMLGKTKPVTATLVWTGEKDAGAQFGYRLGFDATFTIKRSDFGMTYGVAQGSLGDEVTIMAGLAAVRK